MIGWNFPAVESGQIKGVSDAGIENFNGSALTSLTRETCQNSLDAERDEQTPVIVEFEKYYLDTVDIPGMIEYREILEKCKMFWDKSPSEKAKRFLKKAVEVASKTKNNVLRISDYNTKGLEAPYDDGYETDENGEFSFIGWNSLLKIDGGACKNDDQAGAFGIGKNAPYSNSDYRLVFYRTLNLDGERASQGLSRLMSLNQKTSGIGYYGDLDGNRPVEYIDELEKINQRDEVGTDVFVCGFNCIDLNDYWIKEVITAVLDSFMVSICRGKLIVRVQGNEINKNNIGDYIKKYYKIDLSGMKSTYGNYLAFTDSSSKTYELDFHRLGKLKLRLFVSDQEKLDRKVLVVRKSGMKLFRLGNLSKFVSFSGVLELEGKSINKYFREMESVSHDKWEPGRHSNSKEAKKYYDEIKEWIRKIILDNADEMTTEEIDVEGLSDILSNDSSGYGVDDEKIENLDKYLGNVEVIEREKSKSTKGLFYGQGNINKTQKEKVKGSLSDEGESGIRILKGTRKRKTIKKHKGFIDPNGNDIVLKNKSDSETNCPLNNVRVIKIGSGKYKIIFELPHDINKGHIEIVSVGENGRTNIINIKNVTSISGIGIIRNKEGKLHFSKLDSKTKVIMLVEPVDSRDYAMEVNVYEHN